LEDFPGAVVLVTHDRFLLDNVSNVLLALDGKGGARFFADYAQWEANRPEEEDAKKSKPAKEAAPVQPKRRGLSTNEKKELVEIPAKIEAAEKEVARVESQLSDQKIATDHVKLQQIMRDVEDAKHRVEALYERWQDLEQRAQEA
jgi:ABC transport system ATP-binding/permease protein